MYTNEPHLCPNCGNEVPKNAALCMNCGLALKAEPEVEAKPKYLNGHGRLSMALICFFFGALGIHNFLMGENRKGLVRLILSICCGLGWIPALIDFCKILLGTYVVDAR